MSDFTFRVPVALNDLHPTIHQGQVTCTILKSRPEPAGGDGADAMAPQIIGRGEASFQIQKGRFNKTVVVEVNVGGLADPRDAIEYRCDLSLAADTRHGRILLHPYGQDWETIAGGQFQPAAGSRYERSITGTLDTAQLGERRDQRPAGMPRSAVAPPQNGGSAGFGRALGALRR